MLDRIVENLKTAPSRIADRSNALRNRARTRVARTRSEGSEAIWSLQVDALERVEDLLQSAPDYPVVGKVADAAERLVHRGIEASTAVPVPEYDTLNTRKISEAIRDLGRVGLLRVRRYETANKARKTVLSAVDRELERLEKALASAA